jgi:peptidoglycan/LPS O-acetylase OafA/YrhL
MKKNIPNHSVAQISSHDQGYPGKNLQIIDLARSFAILSVMALHTQNLLNLSAESPFFRILWGHFQRNGPYGVMFFFVGRAVQRFFQSRV